MVNLLPGLVSVSVDKWHDANRHIRMGQTNTPSQTNTPNQTPRGRRHTQSTCSIDVETYSVISDVVEDQGTKQEEIEYDGIQNTAI